MYKLSISVHNTNVKSKSLVVRTYKNKYIITKYYTLTDTLYLSVTICHITHTSTSILLPVNHSSLVPHNQTALFYYTHTANRFRYLSVYSKGHYAQDALINTSFFSNIDISRLNVTCNYTLSMPYFYNTFYICRCCNINLLLPVSTAVKRMQLIVNIFINFYNG